MAILDKPLDVSKLNQTIVAEYERHDSLMAILDKWILIPNYTLASELRKVRDLVNRLQPHRDPKTKLYRGFRLSNSTQSHTPFDSNVKQGDTVSIEFDSPRSFTSDPDIAAGFGDTIIVIRPGKYVKSFLRITDELSYVICKRRNIDPSTQCEWLLLPETKITIDATLLLQTKPKWYKFW